MDRNELFKRLVAQDPDEEQRVAAAAEYYREMRAALDETDFRWLEFGETRSAATRLRRERMAICKRYGKLFKRDHSLLATDPSQKATLMRQRIMPALASSCVFCADPAQ